MVPSSSRRQRSSRRQAVDLAVIARRAEALAALLREAGRRGEAHVAANIARELRRAA